MGQPPNVYMLRNNGLKARCTCAACGKVRLLTPEELNAKSEMDSLAYLARRFRCTGCGEKRVVIVPDLRGGV